MSSEPIIAPESSVATKSELRMSLSANRAKLADALKSNPESAKKLAATLAHRFLSIPEVQDSESVATYSSIGGEPPTQVIREELLRKGVRVLMPFPLQLGNLGWVQDDGKPLVTGPLGIPVPQGKLLEADVSKAQVMLIPALAVARDGSRLGRGAGYYDRALAEIPRYSSGGPLRVTLVYQDELMELLPTESHDEMIDVVVTPESTWRIKS